MKVTPELNHSIIKKMEKRLARVEKIIIAIAVLVYAKTGAEIVPVVSALIHR